MSFVRFDRLDAMYSVRNRLRKFACFIYKLIPKYCYKYSVHNFIIEMQQRLN